MPFYAEECASMLAVTFSGGDKMLRSIVSASWAPHSPPLSHETCLRQHSQIPQAPASLPRAAAGLLSVRSSAGRAGALPATVGKSEPRMLYKSVNRLYPYNF